MNLHDTCEVTGGQEHLVEVVHLRPKPLCPLADTGGSANEEPGQCEAPRCCTRRRHPSFQVGPHLEPGPQGKSGSVRVRRGTQAEKDEPWLGADLVVGDRITIREASQWLRLD